MANNDFELNLSPVRKPTAAKGRRANASATKQGFLDDDTDAIDDTLLSGSPLQSRPVSGDLFLDDDASGKPSRPPPRGRRTGGWADEATR